MDSKLKWMVRMVAMYCWGDAVMVFSELFKPHYNHMLTLSTGGALVCIGVLCWVASGMITLDPEGEIR